MVQGIAHKCRTNVDLAIDESEKKLKLTHLCYFSFWKTLYEYFVMTDIRLDQNKINSHLNAGRPVYLLSPG